MKIEPQRMALDAACDLEMMLSQDVNLGEMSVGGLAGRLMQASYRWGVLKAIIECVPEIFAEKEKEWLRKLEAEAEKMVDELCDAIEYPEKTKKE